MSGLKEIRNRIKSVTSTQQITKAMKMVAAAKLRRAQDRITALRPYAKKLNSVMARVSVAAPADVENVFSTVREEGKLLLVVISSDKGLCGGFNTNVLKSTMSLLNNEFAADYSKGNYDILPLGKKGAEFFARRKMNTVTTFTKTTENATFENVKLVSAWIMEQFAEGKYAKVILVYNEFKNVATQIIRNEQYLPLVPAADNASAANAYLQP
jgi:F-type H+-transporting ATPase subunit gamma